MKKLLRSFVICFSMYSRIPMPRVEWTADNMRYVFAFFPLIGLLIGGVQVGWFLLASFWELNGLLYAVIATVLPLLITGGIHMDGYMDTCDAAFSYGDRDKKLEIMKDPRSGAFAVIYCGIYLLVAFGLFAQLYQNASLIAVAFVGIGHLLSRALCGLCTVGMPPAKDSGLAYLFRDSSDRKCSKVILSIWLVLLFAGMALLSLWGAALTAGIIAVFFALYLPFCKKQFGGITGDLVGAALQFTELLILICAVIPV